MSGPLGGQLNRRLRPIGLDHHEAGVLEDLLGINARRLFDPRRRRGDGRNLPDFFPDRFFASRMLHEKSGRLDRGGFFPARILPPSLIELGLLGPRFFQTALLQGVNPLLLLGQRGLTLLMLVALRLAMAVPAPAIAPPAAMFFPFALGGAGLSAVGRKLVKLRRFPLHGRLCRL